MNMPLEQERGAVEAAAPVCTSATSTCVLAESVHHALDEYFETLGDQAGHDLYALVMNEVERPLLASVLERCGGNQSRAAALLGLNRATLRKKLRTHGLLSGGGNGASE
jgi:Fis family transcriptional regulator